jgi:formate dehydrogenase subunit gamma
MSDSHKIPVRSRRNLLAWVLMAVALAVLALPAVPVLVGDWSQAAVAADQTNPRANYWRAVREGQVGYTAVRGQETGVLIQGTGQIWREIRNGPVVTYGAWVLAAVILALGLFHIIFGPARLDGPRSGVKVARWTLFERTLHWFVAIAFIVLALTGLSLLYGRAVLIPVTGHEAFAAYADLAKDVHNYIGPAFTVALLVMLLIWVKESLFTRVDWEWVKQGGGYFGKGRHPHAYKVNAGEKLWFWAVFFFGIGVSITGLFLDFPNLGWDRATMQFANVIHAVLGILLIAFSLGHVYLGSIGSEGTFEGMVHGAVDEVWARQHHDLWLEEVKTKQGATTARGAVGEQTVPGGQAT